MINRTEEEQIQIARNWFKQNGKYLSLLIIVFLLGGFGWKYYQNSRNASQQQLAQQFEELLNSSTSFYHSSRGEQTPARATELITQLNSLKEKADNSGYGILAALQLAKIYYLINDSDKALAEVVWVRNNSSDEATRELARLRQAQLLWQNDDGAQAIKLLQEKPIAASFEAVYSELIGDIYFAQQQTATANEFYLKAKISNPEVPSPLLDEKIKLTTPANQ